MLAMTVGTMSSTKELVPAREVADPGDGKSDDRGHCQAVPQQERRDEDEEEARDLADGDQIPVEGAVHADLVAEEIG